MTMVTSYPPACFFTEFNSEFVNLSSEDATDLGICWQDPMDVIGLVGYDCSGVAVNGRVLYHEIMGFGLNERLEILEKPRKFLDSLKAGDEVIILMFIQEGWRVSLTKISENEWTIEYSLLKESLFNYTITRIPGFTHLKCPICDNTAISEGIPNKFASDDRIKYFCESHHSWKI